MDKFKMNLTWHNCLRCPPTEDYNDNLYVTDGQYIFHAEYSKTNGWWSWGRDSYLTELHELWWADIVQTVNETTEFREELK